MAPREFFAGAHDALAAELIDIHNGAVEFKDDEGGGIALEEAQEELHGERRMSHKTTYAVRVLHKLPEPHLLVKVPAAGRSRSWNHRVSTDAE